MPDIMPGILFGILTSAQRNFAEPDVLPADEGSHVADGAEVAVGVDGRLDLLLDVRDNLVPGPGDLGLIAAGRAAPTSLPQ